jgi:hypothetical protein
MASLLSLFKNISFKTFNLLLGRTPLFIFILAWFLIITGAIFLAQPEKARQQLLGQGFGMLKWPLFFVALYLALFLISCVGKIGGIVSLVLIVLGIIVIIKAFFVLRKKVYQKLAAQFARIPIPLLRVFALIQIAVGALMLILQKRIW